MTPDHALGFEVVDDLPDADAFAGLWGAVQRLRFDLPGPEWHKLWGLGDPMPAASAAFRWSQRPFGLGLDEVAGRIVQAMRASPLFDAEGLDGGDFGFRVVLQPRGARLAAHGDSQHRGTAVFYAHPTRDPRWGGELMIPEVAPPARWPAAGPGDGPLDPQADKPVARPTDLRNRASSASRGVGHWARRARADEKTERSRADLGQPGTRTGAMGSNPTRRDASRRRMSVRQASRPRIQEGLTIGRIVRAAVTQRR